MQFNEGTPSPVEEGDQIIYDVSVQNTGPNRADLTQVTHSLQGSLGFVSSQWDPPRPGDPQPCSPAQAKVSCSLGTLAKDQTAGYKLTLSALRAGNASNRAEVVASQPDPTSSNDSAEVQTQVNAGPVSAIVSTLTASPATAVANGTSSSTVTATLKDASGDPVSGKAVTLSKATGPGTLNISAASAGSDNTNSAGQASFKVTTTTAGTYSVKAETGSVVLSQKPAIRFDPGPVSATVSTLTANPASLAVNTATKATATLKDASGNPVPAKTVSLAKATGPGTLSISPFSTGSATTNSLGQATFLVKTTTAGAYTLKAQTGAVVLSQKPAVRFNPGPVSAAASTVAAAPAAVSANGTSASKLTVTLRDAFSNPVPAKQVSMSKLTGPPTPAGSLSVTCNPCTTNTAGQVVFSVKSTVAGVYSFRAKDTTDNIVLTEPQDVVQVSFWADENNPAVSYRWQTASASSALGGSYIQDRLPGSSASFRFTGTSITWYTAKGPSMGQAELWVDGVRKQTVDLYAPSNVFKHPGYTQTGLTNAPHTIKIVVKGTKSSASKDTLVPIDGFKVGTTTVATPAAPALSTVWARVPNSSSSSGAYARANLGSPTDTATFAFTGKSVAWHSVRGPDQGRARVYIDGVLKQTVDNYAPSHSFNTQVYKTDLSPGSHSIKIEVLGTKHASSTGTNIAVDRFVVS